MPRERRFRLASLDATTVHRGDVGVLAYTLDGATYALPLEEGMLVQSLPERHADLLGYDGVLPVAAPDVRAEREGRVTLALHALAFGAALDEGTRMALVGAQTASRQLLVHVDGSFDPADDALGVAYTLGEHSYALTVPAPPDANGARAEREAMRVALLHARELAPEDLTVQSDHIFHVRRYREDLVHRGRRKSPSLEYLDALVAEWPGRIHFEHVSTSASDPAHRLALHVRGLRRLALDRSLSRAQVGALRRVHYALRSPVPVPY